MVEFNEAMERVKSVSIEAHKWLSDLTTSSWSRHAFDERVKNDHVTNNLAESFNHWVGPLRFKPVLSMLEGIRTKLMTRIQKRYEKGVTQTSHVGDTVMKRLARAKVEGRKSTLLFAGNDEYEVLEMEKGVSYTVNLASHRCTCREWQISGIPCRHAASAVTHKRGNLEEYCDDSFSKATYLRAYGGMIHPIPDQRLWEFVGGDIVQPPPLKRLSGRPRKNRRREAGEAEAGTSNVRRANTLKCSTCKEFGHNKRTCQRAPVRRKTTQPSQVQ